MLRVPVSDVPGADALVSWFGDWPDFHDAEVVELSLNRAGTSKLRVYAWGYSGKTYDKEGKRYYVHEKHAVVTFELEDIVDLELHGFNHQNVVESIDLDRDKEVFRLTLMDCYGISGQIEAKRISVSLIPGKPESGEISDLG